MGSCRIRIDVATELLPRNSKDASFVQEFSSDTTVREVAESCSALWRLFHDSSRNSSEDTAERSFRLWDCTLNPAKDISDWPTVKYPHEKGPKSITLFDAGLFPSGRWLALPKDADPSKAFSVEYDDYQYNAGPNAPLQQQQQQQQTASRGEASQGVKLNNMSNTALPSQVLHSVTQRFEYEDSATQTADNGNGISQPNANARAEQDRKRLAERFRKLDAKIAKLDQAQNVKNANVTVQVRNMLIKSRATGDQRLKMQDRRYFRCVLDHHGEASQQYKYFSPQDSFARITETFGKELRERVEVLVVSQAGENDDDGGDDSHSDIGDDVAYERLSGPMRIYEAIEIGALRQDTVNTIIVRWFPASQEYTPAFQQKGVTDDVKMLGDADSSGAKPQPTTTISAQTTSANDAKDDSDATMTDKVTASPEGTSIIVDDGTLAATLAKIKGRAKKTKQTAKQLATLEKVRQMKMKSKAKGDAKRVPKMDQRFFLEVVQVGGNKPTPEFKFYDKRDSPSKLLAEGQAKDTMEIVAVVRQDGESDVTFLLIQDVNTRFQDFEQRGILKMFGTVLLRPKQG